VLYQPKKSVVSGYQHVLQAKWMAMGRNRSIMYNRSQCLCRMRITVKLWAWMSWPKCLSARREHPFKLQLVERECGGARLAMWLVSGYPDLDLFFSWSCLQHAFSYYVITREYFLSRAWFASSHTSFGINDFLLSLHVIAQHAL